MTKYIDQERARYWPVPHELMAQYNDGSHTFRRPDGTLEWNHSNQIHRDDKPAIIWTDGSLFWCKNGLQHRDGDLPNVIRNNGGLYWHQNGQRHRLCGPAMIYPYGKLEWWINHQNITPEVRKWLAGEEWLGTPEQIFEFQLRFT